MCMLGGISYTKLLPIIFPILQPTRAHPVYHIIFNSSMSSKGHFKVNLILFRGRARKMFRNKFLSLHKFK